MSKIIDLSLPIVSFGWEPGDVKIYRYDHDEGSRFVGGPLGLSPSDFPNGSGPAFEEMVVHTHAGTHLDAPWHYGPTVEGKPAKTIDEVPLEWCYGDGVIIDVRHRKAGEYITLNDIKAGLDKIKYKLKAGDIVLIMTGADKRWAYSDYPNICPGMSSEATGWIIDQGVKVIGIDAFGFDRPFKKMAEDYKNGVKNALWPSHHDVGRRKEYCHIEKLANLDKIPKPYGFKVACFPVKISKAGAGWCRAVAIIEN
jgi:kynurenine formamidase